MRHSQSIKYQSLTPWSTFLTAFMIVAGPGTTAYSRFLAYGIGMSIAVTL
mgnify:CR=1 FL=1